jgi:dihydroorotase
MGAKATGTGCEGNWPTSFSVNSLHFVPMPSILLHGPALVTSAGQSKVDVLIRDGKIEKLAFHDDPDYALPSIPDVKIDTVMECEGLLLFPGLIDCHVHFREPGLTHKATMQKE